MGSREHLFDMIEVSRQMKHCHPIQIMKESKHQSRTTTRNIRNMTMNDRTKNGEALCAIGVGNNAGVIEDEDRKIGT